MKLLIIAAIIWIYFIVTNLYWYINTCTLYKRFITGKEITSYIPDIDEIFKKAGTSYATIYDESKDGYNQRSLKDVSYLSDKKRYYSEVNKVFLITKGTFRKRLKRFIIPIHLLFLPSYLFRVKQIRIPAILKILLNILYWIIGTIAAYHLNSLLDYVYLDYLQSIFEKIL